MTLLLEQVLREQAVALAGSVSTEVREGLVALGASIEDPGAGAQALVYDASATFRERGLLAALEDAWGAVAAAANQALIPGGRGGKVILIAPRPDAGAHAQAARCALENLARTLSVEWARYGITTTAIAPGVGTTDEDVAALASFLLSPAGGYFSGCRFELGAA